MKDRTVMRSDLRLDLKDSGALWSDAELDRCVDRAVSDLSRFLPRERVYEVTMNFAVTGDTAVFPLDTDPDRIVDGVSLNGKVAGNGMAIAAQPDVPRVLTLLITDGNSTITDWHFRIYGTDESDVAVFEDFYFGNGASQTGKVIFKVVNKVELVSISGTQEAGDLIDVGIGLFTDTWVSLDYKPVRWATETATFGALRLVRNTDFLIDYMQGKVKAIAGGQITAAASTTFAYTKDQTTIDLSALSDYIRIFRVEYPVGKMPQSYSPYEVWGRYLSVIAPGETDSQQNLMDKWQVRVYYDAYHRSPTDYAAGSVPEFLENTVLLVASAYALFMFALKNEHQAMTDVATAVLAVLAAETAQTGIGTAFTAMEKYLINNTTEDAKSVLASCTAAHTAVTDALTAAKNYLAAVASDLTAADNVKPTYMGTTKNYLNGGTEPDILAYLTSGDALLNKVATGGENEATPAAYANFAQAVKNALIATFEQDRQFLAQNATSRTNAALAGIQEASQHIQNISAYISQAEGYSGIATLFAREAEDKLSQIAAYLQEATASIDAATNSLSMADRFRTEAQDRRDEAYAIWRDRKEYIGNFASSSINQTAR